MYWFLDDILWCKFKTNWFDQNTITIDCHEHLNRLHLGHTSLYINTSHSFHEWYTSGGGLTIGVLWGRGLKIGVLGGGGDVLWTHHVRISLRSNLPIRFAFSSNVVGVSIVSTTYRVRRCSTLNRPHRLRQVNTAHIRGLSYVAWIKF